MARHTARLDRRDVLAALAVAGGLPAIGACARLDARNGGTAPRRDLYDCEGCEAALECDRAVLASRARLSPPAEPGERLMLQGRIVAADGRSPAAGIIVYAHHTNVDGLYANGSNETEWSRRHGRLRGWVVSDADGHCAFDTIKPAPYPDRTMPAHIHLYIGEPGRRSYYIDDVVFAGEFKVDERYRAAQELRGGSGIVGLTRSADGTWLAERDIRLEPHPT